MVDQLIDWVVDQLMEPKESAKERKNKSVIAIGSKRNSGRCGNGGLVGYPLSSQGQAGRYISPSS